MYTILLGNYYVLISTLPTIMLWSRNYYFQLSWSLENQFPGCKVCALSTPPIALWPEGSLPYILWPFKALARATLASTGLTIAPWRRWTRPPRGTYPPSAIAGVPSPDPYSSKPWNPLERSCLTSGHSEVQEASPNVAQRAQDHRGDGVRSNWRWGAGIGHWTGLGARKNR